MCAPVALLHILDVTGAEIEHNFALCLGHVKVIVHLVLVLLMRGFREAKRLPVLIASCPAIPQLSLVVQFSPFWHGPAFVATLAHL